MNIMYSVTQEEKDRVEGRIREIADSLDKQKNIRDSLYAYAVQNGYTETEAVYLVDEVIIPTVDQYNDSCKNVVKEGGEAWIRQQISRRVENMTLAEEIYYKKELIRMIHSVDGVMLENFGLLDEDVWNKLNEKLTAETGTKPMEEEVSEELLEQVNKELEFAVMNSNFLLAHTEAFAVLIDGREDGEPVEMFLNQLWEDQNYKYCMALAVCSARRNGELPSIPEEAPDQSVILGMCQGIDVQHIEQQVARGKMTADTAYHILKVIGAVVLALFSLYVLTNAAILTVVAVGTAMTSLVGVGLIGLLVTATICYNMTSGVCNTLINFGKEAFHMLDQASDFTYGKLKAGAKKLYQTAREKAVPVIKVWYEHTVDVVVRLFDSIRQKAASKITVANNA